MNSFASALVFLSQISSTTNNQSLKLQILEAVVFIGLDPFRWTEEVSFVRRIFTTRIVKFISCRLHKLGLSF